MFDSVELWEVIAGVVVGLLTWGLRALGKMSFAKEHEQTLMTAISSAVQRTKDKFLAELEGAKDPTSPGGIEVTKAELSAAREKALHHVLDSLKGPALDYAKDRGNDFIKGLIGKAMDKWVTAKPAAATP
jgi:hypothetical protein